MVENLIPRPQLRSRRDQWRRKLAIYTKNILFLISPTKTSLEKTKVASWWPNRADMVENLIPRRQLRSKRDQYRRKLAIYTKNTLFLMSPAKTSVEKTNVASWWPNRADMVENLIPRRQLRSKRDQYRRKLAIYTKNTLFLMSPAKTSVEKNKRCKLMTKPRRYGGESHPATPTQEQTRPMTTEASNLYKKIYCFWYLLRKRALSKQNIANWWPNRADMVKNLIPRRQLRSKRDQYRRKLAIYTKSILFLISPA